MSIRSILETYAELVVDSIDVDADIEMMSLDKFAANSVDRFDSKIKKKMLEILNENNLDIDAAQKKINEQFAAWDDNKIYESQGHRDSVGLEGYVTKSAYFAVGRNVRWVTVGKNCPYCDAMDGRSIGPGMTFMAAGSKLEPNGRPPLRQNSNITHAPLHSGCDCSIIGG
jgi:hypothetical protein